MTVAPGTWVARAGPWAIARPAEFCFSLPTAAAPRVARLNRLLVANLTLMIPILAWGLPLPFLDELFDRWDPVLSSALRYVIAFPFAYLFWRLTRRERGPLKPPDLKWWPVLRLSLFGLMAFTLIYAFALDHMHPVTAAVFSATAPVISAIVARVGFGEPMPTGFRLAVLLSLLGGVLTTVDPSVIEGPWIQLRGGEPLLFVAAAVWAWYSLSAARLRPGLHPTRVTILTLLPAALLLPLVYLACWALGLSAAPPPVSSWRADDLGVHLWFSILAIGAATIAWNSGVSMVGTVVASLYLNLVPIAAVGAAVLIGYQPRPLQLVGMAIVLGGVLQAQLRLARRRRSTLRAQPAK